MKRKVAVTIYIVLSMILFSSCEDEIIVPTGSNKIEPAVEESYTDTTGTAIIQVGGDQVEIQTVDANTGEPTEGMFLRAVNADGKISVLAYDPQGRYLPQFSGGDTNEGRGIISIIFRLIDCNKMYLQEIIPSFMTENYAEAITLLLVGGEIEHEEEVPLGYLGESFAEWGVYWALDETITLILSLPTGGILEVISWTVTAAELIEDAFIESWRGYFYALGYQADDLFIQTSRIYSGGFVGNMGCVHHFLSLEPKNEPSEEPQSTGNITLLIKDVTNGGGVSGVKVTITPGTGSQDYFFSNTDGNVTAINIIPGEHTLTLEHDDYQSRFFSGIIINSDQTTEYGEITINPIGYVGSDRLRFVLTWDENPNDLDLHLWYIDRNNDEHFYYSNRGDEESFPYVELDVDDVTSYGPETMTVGQLTPGSNYTLAVHEYSSSALLSSSGAAVDIFSDTQGQISHRPVPSGNIGERWWWYVLSMDGYGNIIYDDSFSSDPPIFGRFEFESKE